MLELHALSCYLESFIVGISLQSHPHSMDCCILMDTTKKEGWDSLMVII
jgi:hypothetical protein